MVQFMVWRCILLVFPLLSVLLCRMLTLPINKVLQGVLALTLFHLFRQCLRFFLEGIRFFAMWVTFEWRGSCLLAVPLVVSAVVPAATVLHIIPLTAPMVAEGTLPPSVRHTAPAILAVAAVLRNFPFTVPAVGTLIRLALVATTALGLVVPPTGRPLLLHTWTF